MSLYEQAANPAIYTTYFTEADHAGTTMSCTEAWNNLKIELNAPSLLDNTTKRRCEEVGFDPTIPAELQQCKDMLSNLVSYVEGAALEQVSFYRQVLIANTFGDSIIAATSLAIMASRNAGSSMMASGAMANSWIPTIRGILVSVAIMLTPFLVIFLPTPLYGKALGLIRAFLSGL